MSVLSILYLLCYKLLVSPRAAPTPVDSANQFSLGSLDHSLTPRTSPPPSDFLNDPPLQSCPGHIWPAQYDQPINGSKYLGGPVPVRRPLRSVYSNVKFLFTILDLPDIPYAS